MYFNFGEESGQYLIMLLCGLFALWWLLHKALNLFGNSIGMWLFISVVCAAAGIGISPVLSILGIIGAIACLVYLCWIDGQRRVQYYSNRTKQQRKEEEDYGIIDFMNKDE